MKIDHRGKERKAEGGLEGGTGERKKGEAHALDTQSEETLLGKDRER